MGKILYTTKPYHKYVDLARRELELNPPTDSEGNPIEITDDYIVEIAESTRVIAIAGAFEEINKAFSDMECNSFILVEYDAGVEVGRGNDWNALIRKTKRPDCITTLSAYNGVLTVTHEVRGRVKPQDKYLLIYARDYYAIHALCGFDSVPDFTQAIGVQNA